MPSHPRRSSRIAKKRVIGEAVPINQLRAAKRKPRKVGGPNDEKVCELKALVRQKDKEITKLVKSNESLEEELETDSSEISKMKVRVAVLTEANEEGREILKKAKQQLTDAGNLINDLEDRFAEEYENATDRSPFECLICLKIFLAEIEGRVPRVLECGHTLCHNCIKRLYDDSKSNAENTNIIICPYDRKVIVVEDISNLPVNYLVLP